MKEVSGIASFMDQIRVDPRIGPLHISLYMAILYCWSDQGYRNAVDISARELMPLAKIAGLTAYHRTIRQLHEYGYLRYLPSFNPAIKSQALLVAEKNT